MDLEYAYNATKGGHLMSRYTAVIVPRTILTIIGSSFVIQAGLSMSALGNAIIMEKGSRSYDQAFFNAFNAIKFISSTIFVIR